MGERASDWEKAFLLKWKGCQCITFGGRETAECILVSLWQSG